MTTPHRGGNSAREVEIDEVILDKADFDMVLDAYVRVRDALSGLVEQIDVELCIETGDDRGNSTLWPTLDEAKKVLASPLGEEAE